MIVVDSSAFIEYYRPSGRTDVRAAVAEAIAADQVAVNGVIQVEIVAFAASMSEHRELVEDFKAFHWLDLSRSTFDHAAELGAELRQRGVTVPATDLIIGATAIDERAALLHVDAHFDCMAEHSPLEVRSFVG